MAKNAFMQSRPNTVRLGRIAGVGIFVHYSWVVIAGLILLSFWGQLDLNHPEAGQSTTLALAVLGAVIFFGSVLIHELAHAMMARRRGIDVKGITLYLFGGATEADASSRSAGDEFVIAIVGPLTSLATAVVLLLGALVAGDRDAPLPNLLAYLAAINLLLAVFNMAPGLPLDGGRVFRAAVWSITGDFDKATRWATSGGVAVGYLLVTFGLLSLWQGSIGGLWLVAIGWMIIQSARQNEYHERLRSEFRDLVAADIMSSPVITIPAETPVADAVREYFVRRTETSFPVIDENRICGLLSVAAVRTITADRMGKTTAGEVARRGDPPLIVNRRTPMIDVIAAMGRRPEGTLRALVVEDDVIVGIISPSDILRRHAIADLIKPALAHSMRR